MSRPKKIDIREWMKRARNDLVGLNQAITMDNAHRVQTFGVDLLNCIEEIAGLCEERYGIVIECADPVGEAAEGAAEGPGEEGEEYEEGDEDDAEEEEDDA